MRIAHTATGHGFAVEFFEFPKAGENEVDPKEAGDFHLRVVDPDIETLADEIAETANTLPTSGGSSPMGSIG